MKTWVHQSVLADEVTKLFSKVNSTFSSPWWFADVTLGFSGHSRLILEKFPSSHLWALDRDPEAIEYAPKALAEFHPSRYRIHHGRFSQAPHLIQQNPLPNFSGFSGILADLGVSSPQIDQPSRGFSFQNTGPLDMRMEKAGLSAFDLLHQASETQLADIFYYYAQEKKARWVAKKMILRRKKKSFQDTKDLADFLASILPKKSGKHPGTRIFQALRMVVNAEIQELEALLAWAEKILLPGGILVVISFHSLEDRLVKHHFRKMEPLSSWRLEKPEFLRPSSEEVQRNPRSRSAILRYGFLEIKTSCS